MPATEFWLILNRLFELWDRYCTSTTANLPCGGERAYIVPLLRV